MMDDRSFILNNIENFLNIELGPDSVCETLALKPASEWVLFCDSECRRAIKRLKGLRYQISAADYNRHIHLNYADTMLLIDRIREYDLQMKTSAAADDLFEFYSDLISPISTVVLYMKHSTNNCYEGSQLLPEHEWQLEFEAIRQQSLVLQAKLKSKDIDLALQKIVIEQLDAVLQLKACSYQKLSYTNCLIAGLIKSLTQATAEDWTMVLTRSLIALNFNEPAFYDYCKQSLTALANKEQEAGRQCSVLRFYAKEIQSLLPKQDLALVPEAQEIKKSLIDFLDAELRFREDELLKELTYAEKPVQASPVVSTSKLKLNTSMRQIAICINILMQLGVFILEKSGIKGVLGFVAANISTIGSENLSIDSLQKRVSEKNTAASLGLLKILEEMILILKRDYLS
jgi:hypothetical protein